MLYTKTFELTVLLYRKENPIVLGKKKNKKYTVPVA